MQTFLILDSRKTALVLANKEITRKQLSEKSGVSEVTISRIINGVQIPRIGTISKIAKALNCKVEDLIEM